MADTYQRGVGDQISYGYRQLPGTGAAGGPDLKTVVCVGIGVFMGILVGTSVADGSWRSLSQQLLHHPVQVSSSHTGSANLAVIQTASKQSPQPLALKQGSQQLSVDQKLPATQPAAQVSAPQAAAAPKPSPILNVSAAQLASATQQHQLLHKAVLKKKHSFRHRAHFRHRLHVPLNVPFTANSPYSLLALKPPDDSGATAFMSPSAFTVQGEVTVASYDDSAGTFDTYEGETFALDKTASTIGAMLLNSSVPGIQYTCDQFKNCTLTRDGRVVLNAKRTK